MVDGYDPREFGKLEAQVDNLRDQVTYLSRAVERVEGQLRVTNDLIAQAQGGWKVMLMFGGLMAAMGSAAGWLFTTITGR